ncbi:MAG TPA: hypothetical protein V6C99_03570 [Oculatellaceae cyanobacterium]|jgi:hypothetical protein
MNNMGPRNLLILFFSTVAVSLVILIIFFSLFFKNVDLNFNARLPESAPDLGTLYGKQEETLQSKAEGLLRATINVPPEVEKFVGDLTNSRKESFEEVEDAHLPPISDDIVFEDAPKPAAEAAHLPKSEKKATQAPELAPIETVEQSGPPVPGAD